LWLLICYFEDVLGLLTTLKKIFFWNYARNTWQWDLLCVVILIFIFLTPKGWLDNGERPRLIAHQSLNAQTVWLSPETIANEGDREQIEQQVRTVSGRSKVDVLGVRRITDRDGKTIRYEVDIR
jgi:hypothetical protein